MSKFQVIAGSGHCGTMWLSRVLNERPGHVWYHELRDTGILPWWIQDARKPDSQRFVRYWQQIRAEMQVCDVVGDSNSWPPESLPAVNDLVPISKVIYLTRDKERQLYSLMNHSPVWRQPSQYWPEAANRRLDLYAEISGKPRDIRLLVEANDFMPEWLRGAGLHAEVYSLEQLTTDVGALRELAPELSTTELRQWQRTNVNQKVFA